MGALIVQKVYPHYSDGSSMILGDELEVSYPDILPIFHRGLIYRFVEGPWGITGVQIIRNSKRLRGVCIVSWDEFSQGQQVCLRRRPASPEHASLILKRAEGLLQHPYDLLSANCEHFTDICYNGIRGESLTLQKGLVIGLGIVALLTLPGDQG